MTRPPTMQEAQERGLVVDEKHGIHTFSNGTEWEGWAEGMCLSCWYWDPDCAGGSCAFEGAALLHGVSPELARLFGFEQKNAEYGPRDGWRIAEQDCRFFKQRPEKGDDGETPPPPPDPDPRQIVLFADPSEDAAMLTARNAPLEISEPASRVVFTGGNR